MTTQQQMDQEDSGRDPRPRDSTDTGSEPGSGDAGAAYSPSPVDVHTPHRSSLPHPGGDDYISGEVGRSINAPTIARGSWLEIEQTRETTRSRLAYGALLLVGVVLCAYVYTVLQLPDAERVQRLADLTNTMLLLIGPAIGFYFGTRRSDR